MLNTIRQTLISIPESFIKSAMDTLFGYIAGRLHSCTHTSGALAIKTGGSALAKTASTWVGTVGGQLVSKAASDMAALSGTVTNTKFNVFVFFIDQSGTLSTVMGTEAATSTGIKFPERPSLTAMIGYVIINPTGTGNFVGGTTALDDAVTVIPNAVYVNTVGVSDPTIMLS